MDEPVCNIRKNVNEYNANYPVYIPYHPDHSFELLEKIKEDDTKKTYRVLFDGELAITDFFNLSQTLNTVDSNDNAICLWNAASLYDIAPAILDHSFCENSNQLFFITYRLNSSSITLSSFLDNILQTENVQSFTEEDSEIVRDILDVLLLVFSKVLLLLFKAHVHVGKWNLRDFLIEKDTTTTSSKIKDMKYVNFSDEDTSTYVAEDLREYQDAKTGVVESSDVAIIKNIVDYFYTFFDAFYTEITSKPRKNIFLLSFLTRTLEFIKKKIVANPFEFSPDDFFEDEQELNKKLVISIRNFGNVIREILADYLKMDKESFLKSPLSKQISKTNGFIISQIKSSAYAMYNNLLGFTNCGKYALSSFISSKKYTRIDSVPYNIPAKIAIYRIEKDEDDYKQYIVFFNDKKARLILKKTNTTDAKNIDAPRIYALYEAGIHTISPKILSYYFCGSYTYTESYVVIYEYNENAVPLTTYLDHIFLTDYSLFHKNDDSAYMMEMLKSIRAVILCYKKWMELALLANVMLHSDVNLSYIFVEKNKKTDFNIHFQFLDEDGIADLSTFHLLRKEDGYSIMGENAPKTLLDNGLSFFEELKKYTATLSSKNIFALILESFINEMIDSLTESPENHQLHNARGETINEYIQKIKNCFKTVIQKTLTQNGISNLPPYIIESLDL